jgi:hypothetical protein
MGPVRRPPSPAYLLALPILAAVSWAACCGERAPAYECLYVVDYSASTERERARQFGAILSDLESAPEGTEVRAYRMGSSTQEFYSGTIGDEGADPVAVALRQEALGSDPAKGTDFAEMAEAVAGFCRSFKGKELRVRVLTDGGDDYATDRKVRERYRKAAAEICADGRVSSIIFYGVRPRYRQDVRAAFSKAGNRLRVLDLGQAGGG